MKKRANVQRTAEINEDEMWAINKKKKEINNKKWRQPKKREHNKKQAKQRRSAAGRTGRTGRAHTDVLAGSLCTFLAVWRPMNSKTVAAVLQRQQRAPQMAQKKKKG